MTRSAPSTIASLSAAATTPRRPCWMTSTTRPRPSATTSPASSKDPASPTSCTISTIAGTAGWRPSETSWRRPMPRRRPSASRSRRSRPARAEPLRPRPPGLASPRCCARRSTSWSSRRASLREGQRWDRWEAYRRLIGSAREFVYIENQYLRWPGVADLLIDRFKANPALKVIVVLPFAPEEATAGDIDLVTQHGMHLQLQIVTRLKAELKHSIGFFTLIARSTASRGRSAGHRHAVRKPAGLRAQQALHRRRCFRHHRVGQSRRAEPVRPRRAVDRLVPTASGRQLPRQAVAGAAGRRAGEPANWRRSLLPLEHGSPS